MSCNVRQIDVTFLCFFMPSKHRADRFYKFCTACLVDAAGVYPEVSLQPAFENLLFTECNLAIALPFLFLCLLLNLENVTSRSAPEVCEKVAYYRTLSLSESTRLNWPLSSYSRRRMSGGLVWPRRRCKSTKRSSLG